MKLTKAHLHIHERIAPPFSHALILIEIPHNNIVDRTKAIFNITVFVSR